MVHPSILCASDIGSRFISSTSWVQNIILHAYLLFIFLLFSLSYICIPDSGHLSVQLVCWRPQLIWFICIVCGHKTLNSKSSSQRHNILSRQRRLGMLYILVILCLVHSLSVPLNQKTSRKVFQLLSYNFNYHLMVVK